jgi:hypothetical protein
LSFHYGAYEERETEGLIGSDKVEGTAVYGPDNQRIGSIERLMIEKLSGKVAYAVLGFLGRWCYGKTPMQTLLDASALSREKLLPAA